jgi:predicted regulator of Ras-like GTPase activity (Roadblock/LC7/MglB family)
MEEILMQINTATGAIGSMVCDSRGHLLANVFPSLYDMSMINAVVKVMSENSSGLEEITGGVKFTDLRYQNGRIIVKPVDGSWLVLLCESTINLQLLSISLNVAIKKLEKLFEASNTTAPPAMLEKPPASGGSMSAQEFIEKGPLSEQLQGMQTALAKYIGPMAKIIFLECVEKWLQVYQPVKDSLPHFVDIVVNEIDDSTKTAEYRDRVSHFL